MLVIFFFFCDLAPFPFRLSLVPSPLTQSHAHAGRNQSGRAHRRRQRSNEVFLVEEVLDARKQLQIPPDRAGTHDVHDCKLRQSSRRRIEVVVELRTDELHTG